MKTNALWIWYPGYGFEDEMAQEYEAIKKYFPGHHGHLLGEIPDTDRFTILPRFRALPFGRELEEEVKLVGNSLVNSYSQHRYAAELGQWHTTLRGLTPKSWNRVEDLPLNEDGPFIVKGETNSRRQLWKTHCYAPSRAELGTVIGNLYQDSLVQYQPLWIRKFVPLHAFGTDIVGMPISEEYRVFYLRGEPICSGFYWANQAEYLKEEYGFEPNIRNISQSLIKEVGRLIRKKIVFAAVDFALTAEGDSIVIEVNDGQMAGVCGCDPFVLYGALADAYDD